MRQTESWHIRTYQPGDERQILELFKRGFGHEQSLKHWRWKFLDNPAGQQVSLAVDEDGSIIGQFAGLPVVASVGQETVLLTQGVDHVVDPTRRREGIYRAMARHFFETFLGASGAVAWYAFPVPAGFEIEQRAFGCSMLHQVPVLRWDPSKSEPWSSKQDAARYLIKHVNRVNHSADILWNRCRGELPLATVRNSRYLNWRYAKCPDAEYAIVVATERTSGQPAGLVVFRSSLSPPIPPHWSTQPIATIVDWLVPAKGLETARVLLAHCHTLARNEGAIAVEASFPSYTPQYDFLTSLGYEARQSEFVVSARGLRGTDDVELMQGWYYAMGDSDVY